MSLVTVKIFKRIPGVEIPQKQTEGSGAYDIRAALTEPIVLNPGERKAVPTGISVEIPFGFVLSVRPRSGLAINHGVTMINAPGTIDSDYRGEIKILMINLGQEPFTIENGDRIAQLILEKTYAIHWNESMELASTDRGENGFGSTGK